MKRPGTIFREGLLHAGGFVEEREKSSQAMREEVREAVGVAGGLIGHRGKGRAFLLRLDHAEGLAVHQQQVIAGTGREWDFTECDAAPSREICRPVILHDPTGRRELRVHMLAGAVFWREFRHGQSWDQRLGRCCNPNQRNLLEGSASWRRWRRVGPELEGAVLIGRRRGRNRYRNRTHIPHPIPIPMPTPMVASADTTL